MLTSMIENNGGTTGGSRKRLAVVGGTIALVTILTGAGLLLGPVANAVNAARAYDAATPCGQRQTRDCLTVAPATVVGPWTEETHLRHADIIFATADGSRQVLALDRKYEGDLFPAGARVRLISWHGEVRDVEYGSGRSAGTSPTTDNPHLAHQVPLAWAMGMIPFGLGLLWLVVWSAFFSAHSRRSTPWQVMVPLLGTTAIALAGSTTAVLADEVAVTLRWTAIAAAMTVPVTVAFHLWAVARGDTVAVEPRRDGREHVFQAWLLGDRSGPDGMPAHSHLVVGPGVLAFTNEPTGAFRRAPLPAGLVLERVRRLLTSNPDAMALHGDAGRGCLVAQCRDGEREVLIAVHRRNMPWLVGALPQTEPASAD